MYVPPAQLALEHAHGEDESCETFQLCHLEQPQHQAELTDVPLEQDGHSRATTDGHHSASNSQILAEKSQHDGYATPKAISTVDKTFVHKMEIDGPHKPTEEEEADRKSLRTGTWLSTFFLIMCDILGPSSAPYSFSKLGYVTGTLVYLVFGILAFYAGVLLWQMYMKMNSPERPVHTYSDLVGRIFGTRFRHATNVLQSLQLLLNVAVIILGNSRGLSQISHGKVCFVLLSVIFTLAGCVAGQIRALSNLKGLSNLAITLNFSVIFIVIGCAFAFPPNYAAALRQGTEVVGPVVTEAFASNVPFTTQLVGVLNAVYAFGGAMVFVEIISEMKHPKDFIKSLICAESIIIIAYLVYGVIVYSQQGQFAINPANQGISHYGLQTTTNVFNLTSALVAALLYSNVGLKVIYQSVVVEMLNGPPVISSSGRYIWLGLVLGYWGLAFTVCSAVPQLSNVAGLIAALCIQNFSYTFPFLMKLGIDWQESDKPVWRRCLNAKNMFHAVLVVASLAVVGLGTYSAVHDMIQAASNKGTSPFTCVSPV